MLHEQTHWKAALLKRALLLPLVAVTLTFAACEKDSSPTPDAENSPTVESENKVREADFPVQEYEGEVYRIVEEMPEYPGGTEALYKVIMENVQYPEAYKDKSDQEEVTVYVQFVIGKDGIPSHFEAINTRGVELAFIKEALSGATSMGKWTPGKQGGKPAAVKYVLPIRFAPPAE